MLLYTFSSFTTQKTIISWMVKEVVIHDEVNLNAWVIQAILKHFQGQSFANLIKTSQWW